MAQPVPRIYFNSKLDAAEDWRAALAQHLDAFEFIAGPDCADPQAIDIALVYKPPPQGLQVFTALRAVISLSAGINQFDRARMPPGAVLARSVDSSLTQQMVAYAKTAVLRYHRGFHLFERQSREGMWKFEAPRMNHETAVGVLGLGALGGSVAAALAEEGFTVHGWSRSPRTQPGVRTHAGSEGLLAFAAQVDIVVNVLPLTPETHGILDKKLFAHLKPGTFLVNMGRGGHLVEADLLEALAEGRIEAATLDVTAVEPLPAGHPFWGHPGILVTPHVAGITKPATAAPQIAENVRRAMRGEPLLHQVDADRAY